MKKLLLLFTFFVLSIRVYPQTDTAKTAPVLAKFLSYYHHNQADSIFNLFSDDTKSALPLDKTRQLIAQLRSQLGNIVQSDYLSGTPGYTVYKSRFKTPGYALFLNFDKQHEIIGLFLKPEEAETAADTTHSPDNISLKTPDGTLYGTLTVPESTGKVPIVLIIAGSGPTDRNNNSPLGLNTNAFLMLAEALKANGVAVLRYDKAGSGKSKSLKKESDIRFDDFVNDAVGFIDLLKKDGRFSKIIVLGHSEGALVGMLATARQQTDALISLAGAGYTADVLLKRQLKTSLPDEVYTVAAGILDSLKNGHTVKQDVMPELQPLFHSGIQPYLISWMKYNPQQEIARLTQPVLLLQGTTDLQVMPADAQALKKALPQAGLQLIEGMNHVLKQTPAERSINLASYSNPDLPLHPKLVAAIVGFIKEL